MIESAVTVDLTGKILKVFKGASSAFIQANTLYTPILLRIGQTTGTLI